MGERTVFCRVTEQVKEKLYELSKAKGLNITETVRQILHQHADVADIPGKTQGSKASKTAQIGIKLDSSEKDRLGTLAGERMKVSRALRNVITNFFLRDQKITIRTVYTKKAAKKKIKQLEEENAELRKRNASLKESEKHLSDMCLELLKNPHKAVKNTPSP